MTRAERTRRAIIDAAEELWAARGLDGVTLKEIMLHAGCANTTAIQYHFGDRDGLLSALFHDRLSSLEATRAGLVSQLEAEGKALDLGTALAFMYVPIANLRDTRGNRSYAAFQLKLSLIHRLDLRFAFDIHVPVTDRLIAAMRAFLPDVSDAEYRYRLRLASGVFWQALAILDAPEDFAETGKPESSAIAEVLQIMEMILKGQSGKGEKAVP